MSEGCYIAIGDKWEEAEFIGVFQHSDTIGESPMLGGHKGGMIAFPVAVVKRNRKIEQYDTNKVIFKEGV